MSSRRLLAHNKKGEIMEIKKLALLICLLFLLVSQASVSLAEECQIVKDYKDGSYLVKIGDKTLLAISENQEKEVLKLKQDLGTAQQEIARKDELLANYEKVKAQYDITLNRQKEYVAELESIFSGYKDLVQGYKKLKEPWVTFDGGIGATGHTKPAIMLGLGIRYFRVWGFFQENNAGALAGLSVPLF